MEGEIPGMGPEGQIEKPTDAFGQEMAVLREMGGSKDVVELVESWHKILGQMQMTALGKIGERAMYLSHGNPVDGRKVREAIAEITTTKGVNDIGGLIDEVRVMPQEWQLAYLAAGVAANEASSIPTQAIVAAAEMITQEAVRERLRLEAKSGRKGLLSMFNPPPEEVKSAQAAATDCHSLKSYIGQKLAAKE